jgi:rubrerythrin
MRKYTVTVAFIKEGLFTETFDPKREQRVWQRVRGEDELSSALKTQAAREWADAAVYLMLSRQFQGKEKAALRKMFEQARSHGACLRGIYLLITGEPLSTRTPPPAPEPPEIALKKCFGRKLRAAAAYEALRTAEEYGEIFSQLSRQEREQCRIILELLGNLGRQPGENKY